MADTNKTEIKYLDHAGLQYFYDKLKGKLGDLKDAIDDAQEAAEAAQTAADNAQTAADNAQSTANDAASAAEAAQNAADAAQTAADNAQSAAGEAKSAADAAQSDATQALNDASAAQSAADQAQADADQALADAAAAMTEAQHHSKVSGSDYIEVSGSEVEGSMEYTVGIYASKLATESTSSGADSTLIATKGYVDTKMSAAEKTYTFGNDASFAQEEGTQNYKVTVDLYEQVGEAAATKADSIVLTLDASEFVKDSFLQSAKMGTGDKASTLILTMKLADGTTKDIEVDLAQFIDTYTQGNGITINNHEVSVNTVTNGYLTAGADGVDINSEKIVTGKETGASAKLTTQGYVDEKVSALGTVVNSVKATGTGYVSATPTTAATGDVEISLSLTTVDATGASYTASGLATDAYVKETVDTLSNSFVAITEAEIDKIVAD